MRENHRQNITLFLEYFIKYKAQFSRWKNRCTKAIRQIAFRVERAPGAISANEK